MIGKDGGGPCVPNRILAVPATKVPMSGRRWTGSILVPSTLDTLALAKTRPFHLSTRSENRDFNERRRNEFGKGFKRSPRTRHTPETFQKKKFPRLTPDFQIESGGKKIDLLESYKVS